MIQIWIFIISEEMLPYWLAALGCCGLFGVYSWYKKRQFRQYLRGERARP